MFISTKHLVTQYGIDDKIARFFVDRDPPANNLYWHEKLLYLRPAPGYLFIPLIVDLLFKLGTNKDELLSEEFISTMEQIGHISALEETDEISRSAAINACEELANKNCRNIDWLNQVVNYLNNKSDNVFKSLEKPFKALHRGDVFLFALSKLKFDVSLFEKIADQWFALISLLLLLDDADDIESDKESGDENAYLESGLNAEGLRRIANVVEQSLTSIEHVNPTLAMALKKQHESISKMPHILQHQNTSI